MRTTGLVAAAVLLSSCATIMNGTHQNIGISTNPTGAQVSVDGQPKGTTPVVVHLRRKEDHVVRIELEGYKPYEATLTRSYSGWALWNIMNGGFVGLAVDASSGGLYNLTPEQLSVALTAGPAGVVPKSDGLYVILVLAPKPEWQKVWQLERDESRRVPASSYRGNIDLSCPIDSAIAAILSISAPVSLACLP